MNPEILSAVAGYVSANEDASQSEFDYRQALTKDELARKDLNRALIQAGIMEDIAVQVDDDLTLLCLYSVEAGYGFSIIRHLN
jgi:hypothetical protein